MRRETSTPHPLALSCGTLTPVFGIRGTVGLSKSASITRSAVMAIVAVGEDW